jgi:hypothetical protein
LRHRAATPVGIAVAAVTVACGPPPGAERASDLRPASLGEPASAALVVGCWRLEWAMDAAARASVGEAPDSVRLRDEVVFGTTDRLVTPATQPGGRAPAVGGDMPWESRFVVNRWRVDDGVLLIRFWDGEKDAWEVSLGVDSNELLGAGRLRVDPEPPGGPVQAGLRGHRIDCDL